MWKMKCKFLIIMIIPIVNYLLCYELALATVWYHDHHVTAVYSIIIYGSNILFFQYADTWELGQLGGWSRNPGWQLLTPADKIFVTRRAHVHYQHKLLSDMEHHCHERVRIKSVRIHYYSLLEPYIRLGV
jgi:hypothetical protein